MPGTNEHQHAVREVEACPTTWNGTATQRAQQSQLDVAKVAAALREEDPRRTWGFLNLIGHENPERLLTLTVALAAHVDPDTVTTRGPHWARPLGGLAALHPDYRPPRAIRRENDTLARDADTLHLYRTTTLTLEQIGEHVGIGPEAVRRCLVRNHEPRRGTIDRTQLRNQRIARDAALGLSHAAIAQRHGVSMRTVKRALAGTDQETAA